jgi:hypothetical protein
MAYVRGEDHHAVRQQRAADAPAVFYITNYRTSR